MNSDDVLFTAGTPISAPIEVSQMRIATSNDETRAARICHVLSGDVWGGAEAQALALMQGLSKHANISALVLNPGELYARLCRSPTPVFLANEREGGLISLVRRVDAALTKQRPDLIHVHGLKENFVAGLAARSLRVPVVRTHHGRGMLGIGRRYTFAERLNSRYLTDATIAVSGELTDFLRQKKLALKTLRIIRNGIKGRSPTARVSLPIRARRRFKQTYCIGTVGRLAAVKNHKGLLEAFKIVCEYMGSARLTIVGDGPMLDQLRSYSEEAGISSKVIFTGFKHDIAQYLSDFDVFVLPSLHEGIPIALLEAMSAGIPAICTRVGGIPEVIVDGVNGLLVGPGDAQSLAAAIIAVASDDVLAEKLAANALCSVSEVFSLDRCLADTISLYKEKLGIREALGSV